jgi:hypothetical protein
MLPTPFPWRDYQIIPYIYELGHTVLPDVYFQSIFLCCAEASVATLGW